jgi:hypothetical protein
MIQPYYQTHHFRLISYVFAKNKGDVRNALGAWDQFPENGSRDDQALS